MVKKHWSRPAEVELKSIYDHPINFTGFHYRKPLKLHLGAYYIQNMLIYLEVKKKKIQMNHKHAAAIITYRLKYTDVALFFFVILKIKAITDTDIESVYFSRIAIFLFIFWEEEKTFSSIFISSGNLRLIDVRFSTVREISTRHYIKVYKIFTVFSHCFLSLSTFHISFRRSLFSFSLTIYVFTCI